MSAKRIVVVDTNVIISGLLNDGLNDTYSRKILTAWILGYFQAVISQELKDEVNQVLKKPFVSKGLKAKNTKVVLGTLFNKAITVLPRPLKKQVFEDENDHFLLELALTVNASVIVTGDKKVLKAKRVKSTDILNPQQFCRKFKIFER